MTLDQDTLERIDRHAAATGSARAGAARALLLQALDAIEARARDEQLAADYRAGRDEIRDLLVVMEPAQTELIGDE